MLQRPVSTITAAAIGAALCTISCSSPAQAQEHNNFVDPPGLRTASPGSLGRVDKHGYGSKTLILLPDPDFDATIWDGFIKRNEGLYTIYTVTAPGSGGTDPYAMPPNEDFSITPWLDGLTNGVVDLIESKGLDKPYLVSIRDIGGYVAERIAIEEPELIGGIVLVSAGPRVTFPGPPGKAPNTPTDYDERMTFLQNNFFPQAKKMPPGNWAKGGLQAPEFSSDDEHAMELDAIYRKRLDPVSIRYTMESFTTNMAPRLGEIGVPVLVALPEYNYDSLMNTFGKAMVEQGAADTPEAGRELVEGQFIQLAQGDEMKARKIFLRFFEKGMPEWEEAKGMIDDIHIERFKDSRLFVFDDQPEQFDKTLLRFVRKM